MLKKQIFFVWFQVNILNWFSSFQITTILISCFTFGSSGNVESNAGMHENEQGCFSPKPPCTSPMYWIRDEVRISGLSKIRIYSDHLTDRKSMPQIRIFEYTIFRAFFHDFHHYVPHNSHYIPQQYFFFIFDSFDIIKRVQKSKKDNSQRKYRHDRAKNVEIMQKML